MIGATGYIGLAVAEAARRDGFTVFGQTRNHSKATLLAAHELIPIVCDPTEASALLPTVQKCEFVIDCTSNYDTPAAIPNACLEAMRRACSSSGSSNNKKHFLYTSGALVHGNRPGEVVTEDVLDHQSEALAWRIDMETALFDARKTDVDCTVLRPGFVYGKQGGFFAKMLFAKPPPEGEALKVAGDPLKRWSWVHVDDCADGYVRVMHRRSQAAGRVYDLSEPFGPTYEELKVAAANLMGFEGKKVEYVAPEGFEALMNLTTVVNSKRARDELGWSPRHTGIMAQLEIYYEAYKASSV